MPSKDEMLAFFRRFRADVDDAAASATGGPVPPQSSTTQHPSHTPAPPPGPSSGQQYHYHQQQNQPEVDDEARRIANESASALAAAVLIRAERPPSGRPNLARPSHHTGGMGGPGASLSARPPTGAPPADGLRARLAQVQAAPKNRSPDEPAAPGQALLPPVPPGRQQVTLVLDVDETLVHSSFKGVPRACDVQLPIVVNDQNGIVYVKLRPYLREFLQFVAPRFEVVIFTASLGLYCNPLMDHLDPSGSLGTLRLFREHCTRTNGAYIKDLSMLGRPLDRIAIVDNSPVAYYFQPRNAIPILSWFDDPNDKELLELLPLLAQLAQCESVYDVLDPFNAKLIP